MNADGEFSIDEIVVFSPLTTDEVRQIAEMYLNTLKRQMKRQGKLVEITEEAIDHLVEKGFSPTYGARFLKRTIDELVKLPITTMWKTADHFSVDLADAKIRILTS